MPPEPLPSPTLPSHTGPCPTGTCPAAPDNPPLTVISDQRWHLTLLRLARARRTSPDPAKPCPTTPWQSTASHHFRLAGVKTHPANAAGQVAEVSRCFGPAASRGENRRTPRLKWVTGVEPAMHHGFDASAKAP